MIGYVIAGLSGFVHMFVDSESTMYFISMLLMRIGVVIAYFYSYYANVEYFPSDFSTSVFGASNFIARILTIIAPLAVEILK